MLQFFFSKKKKDIISAMLLANAIDTILKFVLLFVFIPICMSICLQIKIVQYFALTKKGEIFLYF